jgi:glycosyltransferase involved in cell wall biosynthesis
MKIGYVLPDVSISGGVATAFHHANRMARRGHEVIVASMGAKDKALWFPHQSVPVVRHRDLPDDLDVLVATSWPTAFEVVSRPARSRCYFVQADETTFYKPGSPLFHAALLSYLLNVRFLTMAEWLKEWLADSFGKDAPVIPNAVDSQVFYPATPMEARTGRPRILIEGAFALPSKGMKEAFEVTRGIDAEVWCVSSYGKPDAGFRYDRFFERVPVEKMREVYSSCDILLKLSKSESFGLPPLEMMACGGVCVVSRTRGHEEYVKDGENGLMVAPDDIEGARSAVRKLIEDRELRERLRTNGLKTAAMRTWEPSIDKLEVCFREAIEAGSAPGPIDEQLNRALILSYRGLLSSSLFGGDIQTIAHRVKRRIKNQLLIRLGEKVYLHFKNHRRLYGRVFGDSM